MRRHALMTAEAVVTDERAMTPLLLATIRAAREGDERAFEELMIVTERRAAMLAWRILGDAEEVKEALQEIFLRLYRHLDRYDERRDFFAWLYRIVVNVCRDLERRRRRRRWFLRPLESALSLVSERRIEDEMESKDRRELLGRAIDSLPPKERLTIILRDLEGYSTEEAAEILENKPATVRVQLSKARAKLKKWIENHARR
jgi:RNA polymerase sigma-70 factor (ECF subfamily)